MTHSCVSPAPVCPSLGSGPMSPVLTLLSPAASCQVQVITQLFLAPPPSKILLLPPQQRLIFIDLASVCRMHIVDISHLTMNIEGVTAWPWQGSQVHRKNVEQHMSCIHCDEG